MTTQPPCPHIGAHLARCRVEDPETIAELNTLARTGDCQFARSCRYCQPSCRSNETPSTPMSRWSKEQIVASPKHEYDYRFAQVKP